MVPGSAVLEDFEFIHLGITWLRSFSFQPLKRRVETVMSYLNGTLGYTWYTVLPICFVLADAMPMDRCTVVVGEVVMYGNPWRLDVSFHTIRSRTPLTDGIPPVSLECWSRILACILELVVSLVRLVSETGVALQNVPLITIPSFSYPSGDMIC